MHQDAFGSVAHGDARDHRVCSRVEHYDVAAFIVGDEREPAGRESA